DAWISQGGQFCDPNQRLPNYKGHTLAVSSPLCNKIGCNLGRSELIGGNMNYAIYFRPPVKSAL
ncbi:hypothetical protein FRC14_000901, partial [Serendipita sp. 396]